ncbi:hypothetical protein CY35_10G096900 [Sphagnum magellanicum]|nr:hypothetical protein CY35_10G096900 [Sphagnum magellanicum]KAH9550910.1 hypothetical protein CY35_10G096900 [Sphagnum magellanicum]KAH9550911.1 hypothetical protein CY35_10G096900 [Sphagnum magellanicum]
MAMKMPFVSTLNPNAPLFVPAAYLAAEDFSPEWWRLIQTSSDFEEYWMKEHLATYDEDEFMTEELDGLADLEDDDEFLDFEEHVLELEITPESLYPDHENGGSSVQDLPVDSIDTYDCKDTKQQVPG